MNNKTGFTYGPTGERAKIVETTSGSVTSTKQFVCYGPTTCEERDGSGAVTKQFFEDGFRIGSASYFYAFDDLGSIREINDSSGITQAQYAYSPFGKLVKISETVPADFQFAGYYTHHRSGLSLTFYRAYDAGLGRWLSRDPLDEPNGNLYAYCSGNPVSFADPLGLKREKVKPDEWIPCPQDCTPPCDGTKVPYWCTWRVERDWDPLRKQYVTYSSIFFAVTPKRVGDPNVYQYRNPIGGKCYWEGPT